MCATSPTVFHESFRNVEGFFFINRRYARNVSLVAGYFSFAFVNIFALFLFLAKNTNKMYW